MSSKRPSPVMSNLSCSTLRGRQVRHNGESDYAHDRNILSYGTASPRREGRRTKVVVQGNDRDAVVAIDTHWGAGQSWKKARADFRHAQRLFGIHQGGSIDASGHKPDGRSWDEEVLLVEVSREKKGVQTCRQIPKQERISCVWGWRFHQNPMFFLSPNHKNVP